MSQRTMATGIVAMYLYRSCETGHRYNAITAIRLPLEEFLILCSIVQANYSDQWLFKVVLRLKTATHVEFDVR